MSGRQCEHSYGLGGTVVRCGWTAGHRSAHLATHAHGTVQWTTPDPLDVPTPSPTLTLRFGGCLTEAAWRDAELARLRAGQFTAEEIHAFCHNLHGTVDAQAFADGCAAEQIKLYGVAPDRQRLAEVREALAGEVEDAAQWLREHSHERRRADAADARCASLRARIEQLEADTCPRCRGFEPPAEDERLKAIHEGRVPPGWPTEHVLSAEDANRKPEVSHAAEDERARLLRWRNTLAGVGTHGWLSTDDRERLIAEMDTVLTAEPSRR